MQLTKAHFNHLDAVDKYHLNYTAHLKNIDLSTLDSHNSAAAAAAAAAVVANELEYVRNLKENNKYFIDSSNSNSAGNYNNTNSSNNRVFCNLNESANGGTPSTDKPNDDHHQHQHTQHLHPHHHHQQQHPMQQQQQQQQPPHHHQMYDESVIEFDDSMSNNGDNSKDLTPTSGGGGGKRKHFDHDLDDGAMLKYKNNSDAIKNSYEYLKNFEGIRARNFDEIQSDEHHSVHQQRMLNSSEYNRINAGSDEPNRLGEDAGANTNVNYASSDDLNPTNSSEHGGEKAMSGSDDESSGRICSCSLVLMVML